MADPREMPEEVREWVRAAQQFENFDGETIEFFYVAGYGCFFDNPNHPIDEKGVSAELKAAWKMGYADAEGDYGSRT